jgi:hypothetical protein
LASLPSELIVFQCVVILSTNHAVLYFVQVAEGILPRYRKFLHRERKTALLETLYAPLQDQSSLLHLALREANDYAKLQLTFASCPT